MAKFKLKTAFAGVSGKLSGEEDMYFGTNKRTGQSYSASLKNPYTGPRSQKQQAVTTAFTKRTKDVTAWFTANKPLYDENGTVTREATAAYTTVLSAYKSQHKYGNIRSFVSHYMKADGTLSIGTIVADNPSDDTPTDTTPSGGNSNPGGADIEA